MQQIPYLCNDQEEFIEKVEEFSDRLKTMPEYRCILATIYVDSGLNEDVPFLIEEVKNKIPDAEIVGGTVSANIAAGVINMCGIALTFQVFFQSTVEIIPLHWKDEESDVIGRRMLQHVRQLYQPVAIQMISSGYNLDTTPFFREMSNIPMDITVFGAVVDDGTVSGQGFVFTETEYILRGMVLIIYKGRHLFVNMCTSTGWQPLGRSMKITGLSDNNTTITQLDGNTTIRDAYERYLGVTWDESFLQEAVHFPVCVERDGTMLTRMPRHFGKEDGSANYGADFFLGEEIKICYGNPTVIVQGTHSIQYDMLRFQPEGLFAVSCWSRQLLLNRDVNQELEICRSGIPSTGLYALGEYIRDDLGNIYLDNMCFNLLGLREGGIDNCQKDNSHLQQRVHFRNKGNSVISHMMYFVQAVSAELEEHNKKLRKIADTDKLTGLYNRGAIDRLFADKLRRVKQKGQPMMLFLLDLDNFKSINDNYGHMMGDAVIMQVANVLHNKLPRDAVAGRWGGDEFIVILADTDVARGLKIVKRLQHEIRQLTTDAKQLRITVSIGMAAATYLDDVKTLFKKADDALYSAKYEGHKNCVRLAQ